MLPAQPSCCRAVKRRLKAPSDAIWITDATLAWAFNRLCIISRPSRRNGTSVPGPLECRRRAGKRRMTHYAEAARPPPVDFGSMWGLGRKPDYTKWQWEAPSTPSAPRAAESLLPSWLAELEAPELMDTDTDTTTRQPESAEHLQNFCESLRQATNLATVRDLCSDFNERFAQSIRLGQVSNEVLALSIRDVPNYIRQRTLSKAAADTICLSFMRTLWDGIAESKVLRPTDIGTDTMHWLLIRLQQLPLQECAPLFTEVLNSMNDQQTAVLKQPLFSTANRIFGPSLGDLSFSAEASGSQPGMTLASLDKEGPLSVDFLESLVRSLGAALSTQPSPKACEHVRDLARISTSYVALSIHRHCASVSKLIKSGATGIDPQWARIRELRKSWLKLVSRLPYATESLLIEASQIMEAGDPSSDMVVKSDLAISDICDILLVFWSRGSDACPATLEKIRSTFESSAGKPGSRKGSKGAIVHFVRALELHSKLWRKQTNDVLRVLQEIRGPWSLSTFHCLRDLEKAHIYLRASSLSKKVDELAKCHPEEAIALFDMYSTRSTDAIALENFPGLAKIIIQDGSPEEIWQAMGGKKMWQEQSISEARIELVRNMAVRFAQAEGISSRVALRNLTRCYHYLSYHMLDIPAEISQLITKVGLEQNILEKGAISNGRLDWVLGIVSRSEGERKADLMEEVLYRRKEMERNRHRDPLRRGPIG